VDAVRTQHGSAVYNSRHYGAGARIHQMARKRETLLHAEEGYRGPSYRLPAYGSPRTAPAYRPDSSPVIRVPGVDDRLAVPEAGEEYFDDPQCQLAYIVRACVAEGHVASTELLTRPDKGSDFATDVCERREGKESETQRYLEELSFEVANTHTLGDLKARARKLMKRGVRRLFSVMVREKVVQEWTGRGGWKARFLDDEIRDRTLKKPLRIRAILEGAAADSLVAVALWEKREPYLVKPVEGKEATGRQKGRAEGRKKGREEGREATLCQNIRGPCGFLGIKWSAEREADVKAMNFGPRSAVERSRGREKVAELVYVIRERCRA